jgi:2-methylisocitrate lyase-like PEP mutase family enzyme
MPTQTQKAEEFRALHEGEPFVMPNPWDAGSAKVMAGLGFKALATTSGGFALTLGRQDGRVTLDEVCDHVASIAAATELPLSVDIENGYGREPEAVATAIERVAEAGAVGGSIEDWDPAGEIYETSFAVERIEAAVEAAANLDFEFTLTARAENYLRGNPDLDDTIARLTAFEAAGADVLYAPRIDLEEIRAVCDAISKPVNALARLNLSVQEFAEAGAQRISIGANLAWVAIGAMVAAAEEIKETGSFAALRAHTFPYEWLD